MVDLIPLRGKKWKPQFKRGVWSIEFLYPPVIHVGFYLTNIYGEDYSKCKVSVWDFYGNHSTQRKLLGEFLIDETLPVIDSVKQGKKVFQSCKKVHRTSVLEKIQQIIDSSSGYVKWKWNKSGAVWEKLYIVNGKVRERIAIKREDIHRASLPLDG